MKITWARQYKEVVFRIKQLPYRGLFLRCVQELKLKYKPKL